MHDRSSILRNVASRSFLPIEGLGPGVTTKLIGESQKDRAEAIQVVTANLLKRIDLCLRKGVAVDPKLIGALVSFNSAVNTALETASESESSIKDLSPLLDDSEKLSTFLSKLKRQLDKNKLLTYNVYFSVGKKASDLFGELLTKAEAGMSGKSLIYPHNIKPRILSRLYRDFARFVDLDDYDEARNMSSRIRRGLEVVHNLATRAIAYAQADSEQERSLRSLLPKTLAGIQGLRLVNDFPHPGRIAQVDEKHWDDISGLVVGVAEKLGPALSA